MKFIIVSCILLMATQAHADVCRRSPIVVKWLEKKLGNSCASIAEEDLAQIKELRWSGVIQELSLGDLDGFFNLETLDLSSNHGLVLPPHIFRDLSKLKTLRLNFNYVERFEPMTFVGLSSIEVLNLDHNMLTTIEPWYFAHLEHLRELSLAHNPITKIQPHAFKELSHLEGLYFNDPNFTRLSKDMLEGLTGLKEFFLWKDGAPGFSIDEDAFALVPNLRSLELDGHFDNQFVNAISVLTRLEKLGIGFSDMSKINSHYLRGLRELKELNLYWTAIEVLPEDFFSDNQKLENIKLNRNPLVSIPDGIFAGLPKLKDLEVSFSAISGSGCHQLETDLRAVNVICDKY